MFFDPECSSIPNVSSIPNAQAELAVQDFALAEGVGDAAWRTARPLPELHATLAASLLADLLLQQVCGFFCVYAQALLRGAGADAARRAASGVAHVPAVEDESDLDGAALYACLALFVAWLAADAGSRPPSAEPHPALALAAHYGAPPASELPPARHVAGLGAAACDRLAELAPHDALRPLALAARGLARAFRGRNGAASSDFREAAGLSPDWRAHGEIRSPILGRNRALAVLLKALLCSRADGGSRARLLSAAEAAFRRASDDHFAATAAALLQAPPASAANGTRI
eukprot:tig00020675_g12702.t1